MTKHYPSLLDSNLSNQTYTYLRDNIKWEAGVPSRTTGFTRFAKDLNYGDNQLVDNILIEVFTKLNLKDKYQIQGIYLNYYMNGTHNTPSPSPSHSHVNQTQLIVSLGATRTLRVGSKNYPMSNGDIIIFGSSTHSISVESSILDGRISIATFMQPLTMLTSLPTFYIIPTDDQLIEIIKQLSLS